MDNIKYEVKNGKIYLEIDCSQEQIDKTTRLSKAGNKVVATSEGWMGVPVKLKKGSMAFNINVVYK